MQEVKAMLTEFPEIEVLLFNQLIDPAVFFEIVDSNQDGEITISVSVSLGSYCSHL